MATGIVKPPWTLSPRRHGNRCRDVMPPWSIRAKQDPSQVCWGGNPRMVVKGGCAASLGACIIPHEGGMPSTEMEVLLSQNNANLLLSHRNNNDFRSSLPDKYQIQAPRKRCHSNRNMPLLLHNSGPPLPKSRALTSGLHACWLQIEGSRKLPARSPGLMDPNWSISTGKDLLSKCTTTAAGGLNDQFDMLMAMPENPPIVTPLFGLFKRSSWTGPSINKVFSCFLAFRFILLLFFDFFTLPRPLVPFVHCLSESKPGTCK